MKAITFLGTGDYKETIYYLGEKTSSPTNLFPKVLCEFFQPEKLLVMVTKQAKEKWFENLREQLQPLCLNPVAVDIPEGHKVEDLWQIFGELTKHLDENDEVIFDITHSFRTLPFLAFIAASYLRVAKNVKIKGIYYGAWEARMPQPHGESTLQRDPVDLSQVFDLTPFLNLLDWTTATDQFVKTGNAEALSKLIQHSEELGNTELQGLSSSVNRIALGLDTLRPLCVMEESAKLSEKIQIAEFKINSNLPQLIPLLKKIENDYSQFSLASPKKKDPNTSKIRLAKQLRMVEWYEKRGRWLQALSLARESIVSLICYLLELDALDKNNRDVAEKLINSFYSDNNNIYNQNNQHEELDEYYKARWSRVLEENLRENLHKFWGGKANRIYFRLGKSQPDLTSLRNDVMHAGQKDTSKSVERTIDETKQILSDFRKVITEILTKR